MQEMTRGSCVVGWVQLDNQTIDPVAPVVVAPTMVEHPQATLQMSFIRNNIKSHSHLNHFEVINTTSRFHYFVAFCIASGWRSSWFHCLSLVLQGSCSRPLMLARECYFCVFPRTWFWNSRRRLCDELVTKKHGSISNAKLRFILGIVPNCSPRILQYDGCPSFSLGGLP